MLPSETTSSLTIRKKSRCLWHTLSWMAAWMLAALDAAFGAAYFPPSPRPADISEEAWQELFHGEPVVIKAHVVTSNGVSWYYIKNWDKSLKAGGFGTDQYYVRVANGKVTVPYALTEEIARSNLCFGCQFPRRPPWTSLGLSFPEAVEMWKQEIEVGVQLLGGLEELRQSVLKGYAMLARGRDEDIYYDLMYPEVVEAYKELGVLPRNFVPPKIPDQPQYTEEETKALREAFLKALALKNQQLRQQREAERNAREAQKRTGNEN